jgi:hypothetical protein
MSRAHETPADVERWFHEQVARLSPAGLGSLSLRRSPCVRPGCAACATGEQHPSYVLYGRVGGRRTSVYVPDALVDEVGRTLTHGRTVQALLYEAADRYARALKRTHRRARR